jgi:hypothetical protein
MKNGIPNFNAVSDTNKVPKKDGIPVTAKALKVFEPKIFPKATECFPAIAALTETTISGKDVPTPTTNIVTNEAFIPGTFSDKNNTSLIVYFAEIYTPIAPSKTSPHSFQLILILFFLFFLRLPVGSCFIV